MSILRLPVPLAVCTLLLAACGGDSPTAPDPALGGPLHARATGSCTFLTPNGKAHSTPAAGRRCPSPKPAAQIAGTYDLTRFTFQQLEDGTLSDVYDVADFLGDDASFELTLHPDGTTSGLFWVAPVPGEDGSGVDADLAGTWRLDGDTVVLDITEEAFFDLLPYTFTDGTLTAGPGTVGDSSDPLFVHEVVLTRQ